MDTESVDTRACLYNTGSAMRGQFSRNSLRPRLTDCCQTNMRTDHEELCGSSYSSFCLNGGICYLIPNISKPFCRCVGNHTGARCEKTLPNIEDNTRGELFAAVLASVVVLSVLVAGAFFFLCRKGQIPRSTSVERGDILVEANSSNGCDKITE